MGKLQQNASIELTSSEAVSHIDCTDRFHNGIDNGEFTALTEASYVIAIIFNSISCPFTVLLNLLVILAVKRKTGLQTNANILLACLAVTDLFCGLVVQPSFILWKAFQLNSVHNNCMLKRIHNVILGLGSLLSVLHISLVTCERLIAIKYSLRYLTIVNPKKILVAVITIWVFCLLVQTGLLFSFQTVANLYITFFVAFVMLVCILFVLISYTILFREIIRHRKMINAQHQIQDDAERYAREDKAFWTTAFVVGALLFSFIPMALALLFRPSKGYDGLHDVFLPWARTVAMLNSVLNPLIYCWRQKEMREFFLKTLGILCKCNSDA